MVTSSHQQLGCGTKDILTMWAIAVSLLQHGMQYDCHWHTNANEFGNTHRSLKIAGEALCCLLEKHPAYVDVIYVPENWQMTHFLAPTYLNTGTLREMCLCPSMHTNGCEWPPLKGAWLDIVSSFTSKALPQNSPRCQVSYTVHSLADHIQNKQLKKSSLATD